MPSTKGQLFSLMPHAAPKLERIPGLSSDDGSLRLNLIPVGSITSHADKRRPQGGNTKRKQTLLSLLDALNELTNDDDFGRGEWSD